MCGFLKKTERGTVRLIGHRADERKIDYQVNIGCTSGSKKKLGMP